jgi:ribosomal protein S18 acetylase RimI-like enzyme
MNIQIRKATQDDLPTLLQFEQGIIAAERPFDVTLKQSGATYYDLHRMLTENDVHLVVAELDDEVVGCGYARIETSKPYLQHSQHAYLGFMYVQPQHRGKGINRYILNSLQDWAVSRNVTEFRLEVYVHNEAAIKAYEKAGFQKHMIEMRASSVHK